MRHLQLVGTIPRDTEALDRAGSWTPWCRAYTRLARKTSSQCRSVWRSCDKPRSNLFVPLTTRAATLVVDRHFRRALQKSVAVINAWRDKRVHECGRWFRVMSVCFTCLCNSTHRKSVALVILIDMYQLVNDIRVRTGNACVRTSKTKTTYNQN